MSIYMAYRDQSLPEQTSQLAEFLSKSKIKPTITMCACCPTTNELPKTKLLFYNGQTHGSETTTQSSNKHEMIS